MENSTTFPRLLIPLLLVSSLLINTVLAASAPASYLPGVKAGDIATYGQISASWNSDLPPQPPIKDFLSVSSATINVLGIDGTNVTARRTFEFINGTSTSATLKGDVRSGVGNLTSPLPWVIAGRLTAPEATYESPEAPLVNETDRKSVV